MARVDLEEPATTVDLLVAPITKVLLRVMTEGRPVLPAGLGVHAWLEIEQLEYAPLANATWDQAQGEVRFHVRPKSPCGEPKRIGSAWVTAPDYSTEIAEFRWDESCAVLRGTVDLRASAPLLVNVLGVDEPVYVDPIDGTEGPSSYESASRGPERRFLGLGPGRYRLWVEDGNLGGDPFEVPTGGTVPTVVTWDLRGSGWATGEVDLPPGIGADRLLVLVDDEPEPPADMEDAAWSSLRNLGRSGLKGTAFRVRVTGDRDVTLRAYHPDCAPADEDGRATLREPRPSIVLRLRAR
jgi:hypothetical protein